MAELFDTGIFSVNDTDGSVGVGWKLNFYITGTSTRQDTYPTEADADAGTNANSNPVIADSAGRFPAIWLKTTGSAYKAVLADANDIVKVTRDPAIFSLTRALASTDAGKGGSMIGATGQSGKTLEYAALLTSTGGLALEGRIGSGIRPEGQLVLINEEATPGHTIMSLYNKIANEESAIESVGVLSTGAIQQQGAQFWRWVDSINTAGAYEVVWAHHSVKTGQDNTSLEIWGRNSVRVCRGDTANASWHDPIPENTFEVYTKQRTGTSICVGPSTILATPEYTVNTVEGFRFECEGYGQFGQVVSGAMDEAVQLGHNGTTGFLQSWNETGGVFSPLAISGTTISIGTTGQSVGFMGATPVARPTVTGSRGGNAALASLLTALANLGLITDSSSA